MDTVAIIKIVATILVVISCFVYYRAEWEKPPIDLYLWIQIYPLVALLVIWIE